MHETRKRILTHRAQTQALRSAMELRGRRVSRTTSSERARERKRQKKPWKRSSAFKRARAGARDPANGRTLFYKHREDVQRSYTVCDTKMFFRFYPKFSEQVFFLKLLWRINDLFQLLFLFSCFFLT